VIVIDASALVDVLLRTPPAGAVATAIHDRGAVHAPHLVDTEVLHVLRRWVARGWLPEPRAAVALGDLADLRVVHHAHAPLRERVWALRERMSAYDATYVALAEALDAPLVTTDGRLARAAHGLIDTVDASVAG
jgi:predicted nucleic acid-binding protein